MDLAGVIVSITALMELAVVLIAHFGGRQGGATTDAQPASQPLGVVRTNVKPFLAGGVVALLVGVLILLLANTGDHPTGMIVSPVSGETVGRDIDARGVLASIPGDQHVWLVVRDGNRLYPQDTEIVPTEGEWSLRFRQGGRSKVIALELFRMTDEGDAFIRRRIESRDFSGITGLPGAKLLDVVENLRIQG